MPPTPKLNSLPDTRVLLCCVYWSAFWALLWLWSAHHQYSKVPQFSLKIRRKHRFSQSALLSYSVSYEYDRNMISLSLPIGSAKISWCTVSVYYFPDASFRSARSWRDSFCSAYQPHRLGLVCIGNVLSVWSHQPLLNITRSPWARTPFHYRVQ